MTKSVLALKALNRSALTQALVAYSGCVACSTAFTAPNTRSPARVRATRATSVAASSAEGERLDRDTPKSTAEGATFIVPAGFRYLRRGGLSLLEAPESDSRIALIDSRFASAQAALSSAWESYRASAHIPIAQTVELSDKDGWTERRKFVYETSPTERRQLYAMVQRSGSVWSVVIVDLGQAVADKRNAAVSLVLGHLYPKGYAVESFLGKRAHVLDAARLERLGAWVQWGMQELRISGAALGLVQGGKVVFADGFGVREVGKPEPPNADTLFMIGSNTKQLSSLLLAKLVDEQQLTWETAASSALPGFQLGTAELTRDVRIKHLICACTGLPARDLELRFEFKGITPEQELRSLSMLEPTSRFGELYQYSNQLAAVSGYVAGHVLYPQLELGTAYERAMQTRVFTPLGMNASTFDYAKALRANHASARVFDIDGNSAPAAMVMNDSILPERPAGAAWSTIRDMLRYVAMELAQGVLPDGRRYIGTRALLARREPQVSMGNDRAYGMGLVITTKYGTPLISHGGGTWGYYSETVWLPEQNVGAVILTAADPGWILTNVFRRKLLEVLFDGRAEADADLASRGRAFFAELSETRKRLTLPADPKEATKLADHYFNDALGELDVIRTQGITRFDFGEWQSEVASRKNPDGSVSFVVVGPGLGDFEFSPSNSGQRVLTILEDQHEYVFRER